MNSSSTLLQVEGLKKYFPIRRGVFKKTVGFIKAVDDVDFFIRDGECLGMVGESGCGKTTAGRCIARLLAPTSGSVWFRTSEALHGPSEKTVAAKPRSQAQSKPTPSSDRSFEGMVDLATLNRRELTPLRRQIQTVFQDPYSSLDPRMSIRDVIAEPLKIQRIGTHDQRIAIVKDILEKVGLRPSQMNRYPHEFSGGQRQRIGIARALTLNPKLLICDEPVSALDVSVQAQVLNVLSDLQQELQLTYLFVAHDLSVVEHISDRIVVMYLGKVVEVAMKHRIFNQPNHPYTAALLAAIPVANPHLGRRRLALEGAVPSPSNPPDGCHFHTRCRYVQSVCREQRPALRLVDRDHFAACHRAEELTLAGFARRGAAAEGEG